MFKIICFVFPSSAFMVSSSIWGSDRDSGDEGCWKKVFNLWIKIINSPPWP